MKITISLISEADDHIHLGTCTCIHSFVYLDQTDEYRESHNTKVQKGLGVSALMQLKKIDEATLRLPPLQNDNFPICVI